MEHENIVSLGDLYYGGPISIKPPPLNTTVVDLASFLHSSDTAKIKPLEFGMQIVSGVAALHRNGVIHRDLCPANIIVEVGAAGVYRC